MRYQSYLNTASTIISSYKGAIPLSHFLKQFFSAEKKYGSKDRKQISSLCYNYYRLGKSAQNMSIAERIVLATFLCEHAYSEFLAFHKPDWNEKITLPVSEKLLIINYPLLITELFPWSNELTEGIEPRKFAVSFLNQPDLFLRIRPGKKDIVLGKLEEAAIAFKVIGEDCIAIPNSTKIAPVLEIDKEVVVQDASSQRVLDYLCSRPDLLKEGEKLSTWDCCAASGGKSILAYDILNGNVELTVSDIRESILSNLKQRFKTAGIKNYHSFIADLQTASYLPDSNREPTVNCQLVLCDAPCTGSGTWSRTPEQLYFFKPSLIDEYAERQKNIVSNAIKHLQKDGLFFYITCSVFKKENEDIVDLIKANSDLQLLQMGSIKGYEMKADSMFVAVFKRNA